MKTTLSDEQVRQLREAFDLNYDSIRLEGGHSLAPNIKEMAFQQVLRYWERLPDVAENVTDTEVRLVLPNRKTPAGKRYTLDGVVDIVRENDRTTMYDLKTHDADYIRDEKNLPMYEKQLNVYAYIWQVLRGQPLDEAAIISTALPSALQKAIEDDDNERIAAEMQKWEPLIPIPFDQSHVDEAIAEFGTVVDAIEAKRFSAAPLDTLKQKTPGTNTLFATRVCRNCDARFSCSSYRSYATRAKNRAEFAFGAYFGEVEPDDERLDRVVSDMPDDDQ